MVQLTWTGWTKKISKLIAGYSVCVLYVDHVLDLCWETQPSLMDDLDVIGAYKRAKLFHVGKDSPEYTC